MDCSLPGSSVHGMFQARILERVAISYSRGLPDPRMEPTSLMTAALAGGFFTTNIPWRRERLHSSILAWRIPWTV